MRNREPLTAAEIDRKIITVQVISAPATIMVGLAIYGMFGANGDAFWEPLNNPVVNWNMLGIGGMVMAWETFQIVKLAKLRKAVSSGNT